ncbi:hypothetical protein MPSEU_000357000 [Mayamaea pseudoterrestris]|nr:hypothetical protein MPSEU_000357000 [Mayamaea pseudoterrestris]
MTLLLNLRASPFVVRTLLFDIDLIRMARGIIYLLLLTALNLSCQGFQPIFSSALKTPSRPSSCQHHASRPTFLRSSTNNDDDDQQPLESSDPARKESTDSESLTVPPSQQQPERVQRRSLDPLVASLTRMDDETVNAKRTQIPLWGELILDKSLMVFLPVAAFAILGFALSVYLLINSQDVIVDTLTDVTSSSSDYLKGVEAPIDDGTCRGLCGSQQESLESLRGFMTGLGGGAK